METKQNNAAATGEAFGAHVAGMPERTGGAISAALPIKRVYKVIAAIAGELALDGIAKDRKNQQQGYSFRGIDEIYNNLAPLLSKHGLCILPQVESRDLVERTNKNGTALFYVTVRVRFAFVSEADGSSHEVVTYGEAMDSGDKATNKAMSAAYKYACLQAFCIPTEGDNDADATAHTVQSKQQETAKLTVDQRYEKARAVILAANSEPDMRRLTESENYKRLLADLDGTDMKCDLMNTVTEQLTKLMDAEIDQRAEA
jgi:hypothetical protein